MVNDIKPKAFAGCNGLSFVNIKARTSDTKIDLPENGWFINTTQNMTLYVPADLFVEPDSITDKYGQHWNAFMNIGTQEDPNWTYISYSGYSDEEN